MNAENIMRWKLLPRFMMLVMTVMYIRVIEWFMSIPMETVTPEATALTATVTGAMTGAFGLWLGNESKS
mgnify:FL=1